MRTRPIYETEANLHCVTAPTTESLPPLSREQFHKFCYHFSMATRAFKDCDAPEDYIAELVGFGARLLFEYQELSRARWEGVDTDPDPVVP